MRVPRIDRARLIQGSTSPSQRCGRPVATQSQPTRVPTCAARRFLSVLLLAACLLLLPPVIRSSATARCSAFRALAHSSGSSCPPSKQSYFAHVACYSPHLLGLGLVVDPTRPSHGPGVSIDASDRAVVPAPVGLLASNCSPESWHCPPHATAQLNNNLLQHDLNCAYVSHPTPQAPHAAGGQPRPVKHRRKGPRSASPV